jgi:L-amino acid dehydrogenase
MKPDEPPAAPDLDSHHDQPRSHGSSLTKRRGASWRSTLGTFSRRTLLKGVAATTAVTAVTTRGDRTAAVCLPPEADLLPPEADQCHEPVDVVVVGAGLAGLTAAWRLVQTGRSVVVLEAQDHVGGRMIRQQVGTPEQSAYVDLGGQWVGPTQFLIRDLATQLGVTRWDWEKEVVKKGLTRFLYQNKKATYNGSFVPFDGDDPPGVPSTEVEDAKRAWDKLNELAKLVNPETPWFSEMGGDPQRWDQQTLADWFNEPRIGGPGLAPFARFAITNWARIGGSGAFEPEQVSLLHALFTQAQSPQNEGPETELFHGGAGQIPELLAGWLRGSMIPIDLESPVRAIAQTETDVTVRTDRACYRARYAIVAIPPIRTADIEYDPPLPPDRLALVQRMPMGALFKVHAVYPTAFWRMWQAEGEFGIPIRLNGIAITDLAATPFTVDSSPPGEDPRPGILTTFIAGRVAETFGKLPPYLRPAAVRSKVLKDLVECFGDQARDPDEFIVADWPENKWIGGAFTAYLGPGVWTSYGPAWRAPHGRIYWAGTETATRWNGYFDGAIQSGQDAADLILGELAEPQPTVEPTCPPTELPTACTWTGTWDTDFGEMTLTESGGAVSGTYVPEEGRIVGTIEGETLRGTWSEQPTYQPSLDAGTFAFTMDSTCQSFSGSWRYGCAPDVTDCRGGGWNGTRRD